MHTCRLLPLLFSSRELEILDASPTAPSADLQVKPHTYARMHTHMRMRA